MTAQYHFVTDMTFRGDPERIWAALQDVRAWPSWWSWLKRIDVLREPTSPDGAGAVYRNVIQAPARYGFTYDTELTAVERLRRIDLDSRGQLAGRGRFAFRARPDGTVELSFIWLVGTPSRLMSFLAPIGRPVFNWNHDQLMNSFAGGLARTAGAKLLSVRNTTIPPGKPGFQVMPEAAG